MHSTKEKLEFDIERRLFTDQFKSSMKMTNDLMLIKFKELDDVKNAVKDSFAYMKLY